MMFKRSPGTWGLPTSWHGWVFLASWTMAVGLAFQAPPSPGRSLALVVLFVFLLYVATRGD